MKADRELIELVSRLESEGRVIEGPGPGPGRVTPSAPALSEKDFQQAVMDLARVRGWKAYHVWDSRKSVAGWPDFVGIRFKPDGTARLVVAELKVPPNRLTAAQEEWLEAFRAVPGAEVFLWNYPADWATIERVLQ